MEQQPNDLSLCKPFSFEEAKKGNAFYSNYPSELFTYKLAIPTPGKFGEYVLIRSDGAYLTELTDTLNDNYKMVPLVWLEGKPVYRGSVLWSTSCGNRRYDVIGYDAADGMIESAVNETGACREFIDNLSWNSIAVSFEVSPYDVMAFQVALGTREDRVELVENYPHNLPTPDVRQAFNKLSSQLNIIKFTESGTALVYHDGVLSTIKTINPHETASVVLKRADADLLARYVGMISNNRWNEYIDLSDVDLIPGHLKEDILVLLYNKLKQAS